jgi:uncharacterized repeat protein (TIGR03803 family)
MRDSLVVVRALVCVAFACALPACSWQPLTGAPRTGLQSPPSNGFANSVHYTVLHAFTGGSSDGSEPLSGVMIDAAGNIFGTTLDGGPTGGGVLYELTPAGSQYTEKLVYGFACELGCGPYDPPSGDENGDLYVTLPTSYNQYSAGTAAELSPSGGSYSETNLYSFTGTGGSIPLSSLVPRKGRRYTPASEGGKFGFGSIVALTADFRGKDMYDFAGSPADGSGPGDLVAGPVGALFGTTYSGGAVNKGTVFKFVPTRTNDTETVLWNFAGGTDGASPNGVVVDHSGDIYGTTGGGGASNFGVVFKLTPSGTGYTETILHTFTGGSDGAFPSAAVAINGGVLYGTTNGGGISCGAGGCGTIFSVSTAGSDYKVRYRFRGGADGFGPYGALLLHGGALYGTTTSGGVGANGVAFRYVP